MIQDRTMEGEANGKGRPPFLLYLVCFAGLVLAILTARAWPAYVHDLKVAPLLWLSIFLLTLSG